MPAVPPLASIQECTCCQAADPEELPDQKPGPVHAGLPPVLMATGTLPLDVPGSAAAFQHPGVRLQLQGRFGGLTERMAKRPRGS